MKTRRFKRPGLQDSLRHGMTLIAFTAVIALCGGCATFGEQGPTAVTVPQVIEMSKSGVLPAEIIRQMRASGTVYRLQASQFADLKNGGVHDEVLNYMQQTYLDAVQRDAAYREWSRWHQVGDYWYGGAPYDWPYDHVYMIK